jgi:U3 small nucleolar RNA-associated protein 18
MEDKQESPKKEETKEKLTINLNKTNKLRKLKKEIGESKITSEEYELRIRDHYNNMNNIKNNDLYKWAEDEENEDANTNDISGANQEGDDLENLLRTNKSILNENKILTNSNNLKYQPCPQVTKLPGYQHISIMSTINFHPNKKEILLTSGLDKKLKIFNINYEDNFSSKLVKTINTLDIPIFSVKFISNEDIIITGRRKHYYLYNIENQHLSRIEGNFALSSNKINSLEKCFVGIDSNIYSFGDNYGNIYLYDISTKRFKYDIKISSSINSICFDDKNYLYAVGDQSEIYIYDLRQYRNCLKKVNDYGNFYTNCMEISYDYNYIATGGKQGYVNLYSVSDLIKDLNEDVEPVKIYDNLTTSCDYVRFNKINSMLGMSSKWKKNALRFVNLENKNVFINFPSFREHMKYPFCFDFNCDNSLISIGNDEGKVFLFHIEE